MGSGAAGAVVGVPGERGTVLRRANQGINVPGGATVAGSPCRPRRLVPGKLDHGQPAVRLRVLLSNLGSSNYHSLQLQGTMRPIQGLSFQGTYVWSKALELSGSSYLGPTRFTNPTDRNKDYTLNANNVTHDFRSYGTFELPFGPNKLLLPQDIWIGRTIDRRLANQLYRQLEHRPTLDRRRRQHAVHEWSPRHRQERLQLAPATFNGMAILETTMRTARSAKSWIRNAVRSQPI